MVTGTTGADILDIKFGDTVSALGGDDTINVTEADPNFSDVQTPYGLINGGAGIDTLVLNAPVNANQWFYEFSDVRSVEKLKFTNALDYYDSVQFLVTVSASATGTVAVGTPMAIQGSLGGNDITYKVTGGMGSASAITLPRLTFTGFDLSSKLAEFFGDDYVTLLAGDASNYVLKASDAIGKLGFEQDLVGNAGNDTLIGSVGSDYLVGAAGVDLLYGNGGNDLLALGSGDRAPVAGDLFSGGSGVDFLAVSAGAFNAPVVPVTFAGTLVSIEGIRLAFNSELLISVKQMAMLPAALMISGSTSGTLHITDAQKFSAAKFSFLDEIRNPTVEISGTTGNDILTGSLNGDVLHGGSGADRLIGGAGDDVLYGESGADTLTGGAGSDTFVFSNGAKSVARDVITDFSTADGDHLKLPKAGFPAVHQTGGMLNANEFYAADGAKAGHDANDRIIYDTSTGVLYYDADGNGSGTSVAIALLQNKPVLAATDILVV